MYPQGVCNEQKVAEFHLCASFHPLHGRPVDAGRVGEGLLGHGLVHPSHANAVADGPAGIEDPLRLIRGWHPTNALAIMILSQQQI